MLKKALQIAKNKVAMLLPIQYLSSKERYTELFKANPPKCVYVYVERVTIAKNGDFATYARAGTNKEIYAWYVWEKGYNGETVLKWIHNNKSI